MKTASRMEQIKKEIKERGVSVRGISDCGMDTEQIYESVDQIPDDASYFSVDYSKGIMVE